MKAGTATKMVLNMITTTTMIKMNKTYGNVMVDLNACNEKLWDRGARIIMHFTNLNFNQALQLLNGANDYYQEQIYFLFYLSFYNYAYY